MEFLDGCAVARVQLDENLHIEISSVTSVGSAPIQSTSGKMFADGQRANALSRQRKDRCGQRGGNHRHADLPGPTRYLIARYQEDVDRGHLGQHRSEEHTSELQSLMRISYAVFCLKKKK